MYRVIQDFLYDGRGNVAIMFGMMAIPMVALVGMGIDYNRGASAHQQLSTALDAAALALARNPNLTDEQARPFLENYLTDQLAALGYGGSWEITDFEQEGPTVDVSMAGSLDTLIMGLVNVDKMDIGVTTQVVREQKKVELALVLDNTGSMRGDKIAALRTAAKALVEIMYDGVGAKEKVRIALVPFVTAVNIRVPDVHKDAWMDTNAQSEFHGVNFNGVFAEGELPASVREFVEDSYHIDVPSLGLAGPDLWRNHWNGMNYSDADIPFGLTKHDLKGLKPEMLGMPEDEDDMEDLETRRVNHFDLYDALDVTWKGCVEARPSPYDVNDTAPDPASPDTLFVPWFWPDEPDTSSHYANDYLKDVKDSGTAEDRQKNLVKYILHSTVGDEDHPQTFIFEPEITESDTDAAKGPNKSCGQPLLPLTNDEAKLNAEIGKMLPWNLSGTNIAQGLVWGWRVLSPGEPFTGGVPYEDDDTMKAIVLLSDGENQVTGKSSLHNKSDYNAYNYMSHSRLGTTSTWSAKGKVNDKVETLCQSIKGKGIRIYTILFDLNSSTLKTLFRDCASKNSMYFDNPSNEKLKSVFQEIAYDLSNLRISK